MRYLEYQEKEARGSKGFPFAYYHVTSSHPSYNMVPHWHNEYEIIRVLKGKFDLLVNNSSFLLKEGDTALVSSGFIHSGTPFNCIYDVVVFDMDFYLKAHPNLPSELKAVLNQQKRIDTFFSSSDTDFQVYFSIICNSLSTQNVGYSLMTEGALWQLLGLILQKKRFTSLSETTMTYNKKFKELKIVLNYIAAHYNEYITLNDLAGSIHMNPNYFCKFFKDIMQKSPIEYLNSYRIERACEKLRSSSSSVLNTALDCGFNDVNYFIKVFKRYKGSTPLQYAKHTANLT